MPLAHPERWQYTGTKDWCCCQGLGRSLHCVLQGKGVIDMQASRSWRDPGHLGLVQLLLVTHLSSTMKSHMRCHSYTPCTAAATAAGLTPSVGTRNVCAVTACTDIRVTCNVLPVLLHTLGTLLSVWPCHSAMPGLSSPPTGPGCLDMHLRG
jgi:hypothetical protein